MQMSGIRMQETKGFTLIEVLIAVLLLGIGLISMASLAATVINGNASSSRLTTATTLAEDKLEEIQRRGYANAENSAGTESSVSGYTSFSRTTTVTAGSPGTGMKTATVTVSWDSGSHSLTMQTILAE